MDSCAIVAKYLLPPVLVSIVVPTNQTLLLYVELTEVGVK